MHAPASGPVFSQTGCAASGQLGAPSATQPVQVCVVAEQTGVVPPQSALPRQATQTPPPPVVSHSGALAAQWLVSVGVQTAQAPVLRHTGNFGSQSALERHARHVWSEVSQMGRVPEQSALATQSTHALVAVSHTCCATAHAPGLPAAHGTHAPLAPHTGADTSHSLSSAQVRQACVVPSHTGVAPPQSADETHATQSPSVASHSAVAPEHAVVFVVEQAPHAPLGSQAVVAPPHSPSASQPRQTCVTPSQTGLVAVVH